MDDIIFPEIADNAPRDEVLAWYNEIDRILNKMLEHSLALEEAAKKKAKKKKCHKVSVSTNRR